MKGNRYGLALLLLLILAPGASARQSGGIFLHLDGIEGESQDDVHKGWIDVLAYSHGTASAFDFGSIGGGGGAAQVQHSPIYVTKRIGKSTPLLFEAVNTGTEIPGAQFEFIRAGQTEPYFAVTLQKVHVTSYQASGSAGDVLYESFSFVYGRIEIEYWEFGPDGTRGASTRAGWDVITNTNLAIARDEIDVQVDGPEVVFSWQTTDDVGYYGYEVQHLEEAGYRRAAYVPATGWSTQGLEYEVRIRGLSEGVHVFRLAGLGVDGSIAYSDEYMVTIGEPSEFRLQLDAPYPNPVADRATITVSSDRYEHGRVAVYDMLGREVAVLLDEMLRPGIRSELAFEPSGNLPAGVYLVRATAGAESRTQMVTVMK